jgi:hypothetical protein
MPRPEEGFEDLELSQQVQALQASLQRRALRGEGRHTEADALSPVIRLVVK